jgi:hypothetical protein
MPMPFNSDLVLDQKISDATFKAYSVGYDQNKFRLQPLVDIIINVLPEFAFGYDHQVIPITAIIKRLRQAARSVYTTDKYLHRGEFGELILHLLLRDWCNTLPLISKIYFKDAYDVTVHGFDGIHVTIEGDIKKLWLGESKLYGDGRAGVLDLANDLKNHIAADYLRQEFDLVSKRLPVNNFPEIEYWRNLMDEHQRLDTIYSSIVIPMLCTYSSNTCSNHCQETEEYVQDFIVECRDLRSRFESAKIVTNVEVILMLLPVPDKDNLVTGLNERLKAMQSI